MANYIRYANQGATRNQQLSEDLLKRLAYLEKMGVTAEVFSGGQPEKGSGLPRVGSTRHDHGHAADVWFHKDGKRLNWANEADRPIFEDIVRQGKQAGITGWGAGPGYMSEGSMHVGMGKPGVWGAGGKSANAPSWLNNAYYGGADSVEPSPSTMVAAASDRKIDPVSSSIIAQAKAETTPAGALNAASSQAASAPKPEEPKSLNGPLVQAFNKLTGSNAQVPETIGGAKTGDVMSAISGIGTFAQSIAEQDAALNKQAMAAAATPRVSTPIEIELMGSSMPLNKRKRRGGLGSLGGYLV